MKGRKPTTTGLKSLQGTLRADRMNAGAPAPEGGAPELPSTMHGREAEIFLQLSERIDKLKMASPSYSEMLALAAKAAASIERYDQLIELHGDVYKSPKGLLKKNPAVDLKHQAMRDLRLYLLEFGLSPREITRVNVIPGNENQMSMFGMFRAS